MDKDLFKEVDIESEEMNIENAKVDIRNRLLSFSDMIFEKTINHSLGLVSKCGKEEYFGRTTIYLLGDIYDAANEYNR